MWIEDLSDDLHTIKPYCNKESTKELQKLLKKQATSTVRTHIKPRINENIIYNTFTIAILKQGEDLVHEIVYQHNELLLILPLEYLELICILYLVLLQQILASTQIHTLVMNTNHKLILKLLYLAIEKQGYYKQAIDWGINLLGFICNEWFTSSLLSTTTTTASVSTTTIIDDLETFKEFKAMYGTMDLHRKTIGEYILRVALRNTLNHHYLKGCQDIPYPFIKSVIDMTINNPNLNYNPTTATSAIAAAIAVSNNNMVVNKTMSLENTAALDNIDHICKTRFPWLPQGNKLLDVNSINSNTNISNDNTCMQINPIIKLAQASSSSSTTNTSDSDQHHITTTIATNSNSIYAAEDEAAAAAAVENSPVLAPPIVTKLFQVSKDLYTGSTLSSKKYIYIYNVYVNISLLIVVIVVVN